MVEAQRLGEEGKDDQVDDVAGHADHAELEELHPVLGLPRAEVDAADECPGPIGAAGPRIPRSSALAGRRRLDHRAGLLFRSHRVASAMPAIRSSGPSPIPKWSSMSPATS